MGSKEERDQGWRMSTGSHYVMGTMHACSSDSIGQTVSWKKKTTGGEYFWTILVRNQCCKNKPNHLKPKVGEHRTWWSAQCL